MFDNEKTGKYIMILRKAKKYTQQKLADKLGVSHQAVSLWERGATMPDIAILPALAELLGTTTDKILSASSDDFTGFDEIIDRVNLIKQKKRSVTKDEEVKEYLSSVIQKLNELVSSYDE
ncbi:MAG: helix-turn-helix domain-containing protein [Oscillospiraceae bacterium]|nr:helix-turn-helix domain-containing protein [Oscillospiraceae bacterium]